MKDNKLIAEFMGWDIESLSTIPSNLHPSNLELDNDEVLEYKYHTSWDWLMPVVQKIDAMFAEADEVDDAINRVHNAVLSFDIDNTYDAAVKFIKTYNDGK